MSKPAAAPAAARWRRRRRRRRRPSSLSSLLLVVACVLVALLAAVLPRPAQGFHAPAAAARPSAFLPSPTAARVPRSSCLLNAPLAAAGADGESAAVAAAPAPASPTAKLCRNCKQYFEPAENGDRACRYHTKSYTGDTKRKGDWSANADRFENERQWWCCGEPALDAPGCKYDRHRSYDDE